MNNTLTLRDITEDDLFIFFELQLDLEAIRMAAFPARSKDAFFQHWKDKILKNNDSQKKTIIAGGEVAGYVLSWEQEKKLLIGYWIGKEYWGKKIATNALNEFLQHLKSRPVYAYVVEHNIASIRVLEKCGFKILKRDHFFSEVYGHDIDELLMELT